MNYRLSPAIFEICLPRCLTCVHVEREVHSVYVAAEIICLYIKGRTYLHEYHDYEWILYFSILLAPSLLSLKLKRAAGKI